MNLEKLKDTARKLEQKEDWRKAIEVYLKAIQQAESGAETTPDLSLYNRVGDLYLKINDTAEAVRSYERAVDLYADQGFFNNAIALCGKILRVNPGRTQTYLKLAQLHARKNVVIEAKRNLIEFLERMNALGQLDQAFQAVKLFADQFSGSQEIRAMLVELLRATSREDEAQEQLEKMAQDLEAMGDKAGARKTRERIQAAEAEHGSAPPPPAPVPPSPPRKGDLIFLDTGVDIAAAGPQATPYRPAKDSHHPVKEPSLPVPEPEPPPLPEPAMEETTELIQDLIIEPMVEEEETTKSIQDLIVEPMVEEEEITGLSDSLLGLERIGESAFDTGANFDAPLDIQREEPTDLGFEGIPLEGMESTSLDALHAFSTDPEAGGLDLADDILVSLPDPDSLLEPEPELEGVHDQDLVMDSLSLVDAFPMAGEGTLAEAGPPADQLADLENRVLDDPENPDIHLEMAEGLLAVGETARVTEELELALAGYEDREDWPRAAEVADRLVELAPDSIGHHQKRVELAFRTGDREPLLEAYMGLGDALSKSGAVDKAIAVYGRVIEHDPGNARAEEAIARVGGTVTTPPPPPVTPRPAEAAAAPPTAPAAPAAAPPVSPPAAAAPAVPVSPPATAAPVSSPATAPPVSSPAPPPAAPAPTPPPARSRPAAETDDFIDLGSMVMEEEGRRDTRMRVDRREPKDQDEQREFHEILEQFKRGIDQNIDSEDYQAHYDLGVAFKEMGLLDEAIAEFQKALRSPEGRLRTSEALGQAFFEKGQYAVCESVLRRAVEGIEGSDEMKIGLIYWQGRASEAMGKEAEAIASYERALVVDIRFMDLSQRVQRLSAGRRQ